MAMLIRAGLPSRKAAIAAVETAQPNFVDIAGLRAWLGKRRRGSSLGSGRLAYPTDRRLVATIPRRGDGRERADLEDAHLRPDARLKAKSATTPERRLSGRA